MLVGQGNNAILSNNVSAAPFTSNSAVNGTSVNGAGQVVLGNDAGGAAAALTSAREIPGSFPIAITQGKIGVGLNSTTLSTYVQNSAFQNDGFGNTAIQGTTFVRLTSTPTATPLVANTIVALSAQNSLMLAGGSISGGPGTVVASLKGNTLVTGSNGTKSLQTISSIASGNLMIGVVNLTRLAGFIAQSPDVSSIGAGSSITEVVGLVVESQATLTAVSGARSVGIMQLGANDVNVVAGLPARTGASGVVVRDNGTNELRRLAGASGSFTAASGEVVTVVDGVITSIV